VVVLDESKEHPSTPIGDDEPAGGRGLKLVESYMASAWQAYSRRGRCAVQCGLGLMRERKPSHRLNMNPS